MKRILLSKTSNIHRKQYALVDDKDFEWLNQWNWSLGSTGYAYRREHLPSTRKMQKCKIIKMHRLLMGFPDALEVDHKDRNPLNNQRSNLRLCTSSQNKINQKIRIDNKSGYKGVIYTRNLWLARIWLNGHAKHLGYHKNIEDAIKARKDAAEKYYDNFSLA